MKPLIFLFIALLSLNLHAREDGGVLVITSRPTLFTLGGALIGIQYTALSPFITTASTFQTQARKLAEVIQNDSQEYFLTGTMSLFLENQTEIIIAQNPDLSESEAITALNEWADAHL